MLLSVVLEKTLESPLDCKEIKSVNPKGNQSWIFIGRTDAEAEVLILWPLDVKKWLIWKDPGAGKNWRQEEKGMTENEMVGWHYQLNGHEFEQVSDEQGSLVWCSSWGWTRLSDWTELNWCVVERGKIGFQLNKSHGSKTLLLLAFLLVKLTLTVLFNPFTLLECIQRFSLQFFSSSS